MRAQIEPDFEAARKKYDEIFQLIYANFNNLRNYHLALTTSKVVFDV